MQLDHHPKGDEIQDYLKDITGKVFRICFSKSLIMLQYPVRY